MVLSSDLNTTSGECSGNLSSLARFPIVSDTVLEPVLTGVEIRVFLLLVVFDFLKQLLHLLFSQFLAIDTLELFLNFRHLLFVFFLLFSLDHA
jgi:hypothetical protein